MMFCAMCKFFLICRGISLLDGDDPEVLSTIYGKVCNEFKPLKSMKELFGETYRHHVTPT